MTSNKKDNNTSSKENSVEILRQKAKSLNLYEQGITFQEVEEYFKFFVAVERALVMAENLKMVKAVNKLKDTYLLGVDVVEKLIKEKKKNG